MFTLIDTNFPLKEAHDLLDLESLNVPVVVHQYGTTQDYGIDPFWLQYSLGSGSITFTQHLIKLRPKFNDFVVEYLQSQFKPGLNFLPKFVNLFYTQGSIPIHVDEAGRKTAINIGLHNSESAITYYSPDNDSENYELNKVSCKCVNGSTYILNTANLHSVDGQDVKRYMITYALGVDYNTVRSLALRHSD